MSKLKHVSEVESCVTAIAKEYNDGVPTDEKGVPTKPVVTRFTLRVDPGSRVSNYSARFFGADGKMLFTRFIGMFSHY